MSDKDTEKKSDPSSPEVVETSAGQVHSTEAGTEEYSRAHGSAKSLGRSMVTKFFLLSSLTIAIFGLIFGYFVNENVQESIIKSYAITTSNNTSKIITPFIEERDLATPYIVNEESDFCNPEKNPVKVDCSDPKFEHYKMNSEGTSTHYDEFKKFLDEKVLTDDINKIKVWGVNGEVLYHSLEPELIGQIRNLKSPALADLNIALSGSISAQLTGSTSSEGGGEADIGEQVEVYAPFYLPGDDKADGVFEAYFSTAPLQEQLSKTKKTIFGSLGILFVLLIGTVQVASVLLMRQNSTLQDLSKKLETKADTDGLTGIHNHRHFQSYLGAELERAVRYKRPVSLLLIDLDFFKAVNDNYGHQTGDAVLIKAAGLVAKSLRQVDYVARYGGEEFVCILPETEATEATAVAERLRKELADTMITAVDGQDINVTMSIGVADAPSCATDKDSLIAAADSALYFAKQKGRNRVVYFREFTDHEVEESDLQKLFNRLRNASISTIQALAMAVDARDSYSFEQNTSIARYSEQIAEKMGMNAFAGNALKIASQIHDIGKISLPDRILHKTEALTDEEKEMIKKHPDVGKQILETATEMQYLLPAVMFHHERWDGEGYPQGLKGEEIPMLARVLHVFDSYQAMTSDRPYRKALTPEECIAELRKNSGTQFDPSVAEAFIAILEEEASRGGKKKGGGSSDKTDEVNETEKA